MNTVKYMPTRRANRRANPISLHSEEEKEEEDEDEEEEGVGAASPAARAPPRRCTRGLRVSNSPHSSNPGGGQQRRIVRCAIRNRCIDRSKRDDSFRQSPTTCDDGVRRQSVQRATDAAVFFTHARTQTANQQYMVFSPVPPGGLATPPPAALGRKRGGSSPWYF